MYVNGCTVQRCKRNGPAPAGESAGPAAATPVPPAARQPRARAVAAVSGDHRWTWNADGVSAICNGLNVSDFLTCLIIRQLTLQGASS